MLQIIYKAVKELMPSARNARKHSDKQIKQIAASIKEFGFTNPVLIDGAGEIIAGHGRVLAALQLEMEQVPCIELGHLSEVQKRAYALADNRIPLNSGWDEDLLAIELQALRDGAFDVSVTGFAPSEIVKFCPPHDPGELGPGGVDEDAADEVVGALITERGDLWLLGEHRLLCGDARLPEDVQRLMGEARALLMATDPPYGVSHIATKDGILRSGFSDMAERWEDIEGDELRDQALQQFLTLAFTAAKDLALQDNAAWYLWHAHLTQGFFAAAAAAAAADVLLHRQIIWEKPGFVLTRSGMYHWRHEPCFFGWRRGFPPPWHGDKSQSTVWPLGRDAGGLHPTQKPVALWEAPILNHTRPGEAIYEPFAGAGSQLIAAEKHGRRCYALEISPEYCDVIVRRWMAYTGREDAARAADGARFVDLEKMSPRVKKHASTIRT